MALDVVQNFLTLTLIVQPGGVRFDVVGVQAKRDTTSDTTEIFEVIRLRNVVEFRFAI